MQDAPSLFDKMRFSGTWRDYQARVLEEMDSYFGDNRLHIVAAPGSGKTILGLEVMRRLANPTIILSPTRTIRDQWQQRLFPLFLSPFECWDDHISDDLERPAMMVSTTYQALHSFWTDGQSASGSNTRFDLLISNLKDRGPITLIVDECHHLRKEWWNALFALKDCLPNLFLVSLTATPPYDAPHAEWLRYEQLCGPIDIEISIPELVRNGDLCPHQDYIHISVPEASELELLQNRRSGLSAIVTKLIQDVVFAEWLHEHSWLNNPEVHEEEILEAPEFYSSILVFLNAANLKLPKKATDLLGVSASEVPPLSSFWLETFLNGLLYDHRETFPLDQARRKALQSDLSVYGLIEGRKVRLCESQNIAKLMAGSLAKFDSISAIANAEANALGDQLRMVILTDHVRADELSSSQGDNYAPSKLGVVPIFGSLRKAAICDQWLAVLTGSLVIVPQKTKEQLYLRAKTFGLDPNKLKCRPISGIDDFMQLSTEGGQVSELVALVTDAFNSGHLRILVGTQALLGEGWDAPSINSLILASNVGAFMLSNQMRGRAIRVSADAPAKVSNIWHLATIEPPETRTNSLTNFFNWGSNEQIGHNADLALLNRRFEMFEGISNGDSDAVENGLERLNLSFTSAATATNVNTLALASARAAVSQKWQQSLGDGTSRSHTRKVAAANYAPSRLVWHDTFQHLVYCALSAGAFSALNGLRDIYPGTNITLVVMAFAGLAFLYSLPKLVRSAYLVAKHGTLERSLKQVGQLLLEGLHDRALLSYDQNAYELEVTRNLKGHYDVVLLNGTRADERVFLEALAEILGPVQNPRYLLVRRNWLGRLRQTDFHNVPSIFAAQKEHASTFQKLWEKHVGRSELIFTRTSQGRKLLLKARANSFASSFQRRVDRRSKWL